MAMYIDRLVVEIRPTFEVGLGVVHDWAVAMADAVVVLIPRRDLVIRQKADAGWPTLVLLPASLRKQAEDVAIEIE